jgi:hypothetical protein
MIRWLAERVRLVGWFAVDLFYRDPVRILDQLGADIRNQLARWRRIAREHLGRRVTGGPGPVERAALTALLAENEAEEQTASDVLFLPVDVDTARQLVDRILTLRERRVPILQRLGRHYEAARLRADTADRRAWAPIREWPET